jgi:hypothetical protein
MRTLRNKLLVVAAVAILWTAIQPGIASAQSSGIGGDGFTRALWRATDGSISLWKLDGSLNLLTSHVFGPYTGWTVQSLSSGPGSELRVIWRYTTGMISIWNVDAGLSLINSRLYGPYFGYDPGAP